MPQRQHNEDRLRRAESWLTRSGEVKSEAEEFVLLWIAFNAAYGAELGEWSANDADRTSERQRIGRFFRKLVDLDGQGVLKNILISRWSQEVRVLLKNPYVYAPFWHAVQRQVSESDWKKWFNRANQLAFKDLAENNVGDALQEVFQRLYVLRNQLMHGAATFDEGWGNDQVRDGCRIMRSIVPEVLAIMQAHINANPNTEEWGPVAYPRINRERDQPGPTGV